MIAEWLPLSLTAILVFFLVLHSAGALLIFFSIPEIWSQWRLSDAGTVFAHMGAETHPAVSVIVMVSGNGEDVVERVQSFMVLDYPRYDVIVVNDSTSDTVLTTLIQAFDLYEVPPAFTVTLPTEPVRAYYRSRLTPNLLFIDKVPGGIADALNAGLNAARYAYTLIVGRGLTVEPDILQWLIRPFILQRDVSVVVPALGISDGFLVENGRRIPRLSRRLSSGVLSVRYIQNFLCERLGWNRLANGFAYPLTVGLFRHDLLLKGGGHSHVADAPAMDLSARLYRSLTDLGMHVKFAIVPYAMAWRQPPGGLTQQADFVARWQRGMQRILWQHRVMLGNPEYGRVGMLVMPFVCIRYLVAPFLELAGYIGLIIGIVMGVVSTSLVWAYLAGVLGYGVLLSLWAVMLEALTFRRYTQRGDLLRLVWYAVADWFGYRQILAWIRIRTLFDRSPTL